MMNEKEFILHNFAQLSDGETSTGKREGVCWCGKSPNRCDLGVKGAEGGLLYNCFSNGCGLGGGRVTARGVHTNKRVPAKQESDNSPISLPDSFRRSLPRQAQEYLRQFNILPEVYSKYDIGWDGTRKRIVFPLTGSTGLVESWTARSPTGGFPKWLFPKGHDGSLIFPCGKGNVGILVEDILSAIRLQSLLDELSEEFNVIALMGTSINNEKLLRLRSTGIKEAFVLLDGDATATASKLSFVLTKGGIVGQYIRLVGEKDIKEYTERELHELLSRLR
jgi:hypothetical protein